MKPFWSEWWNRRVRRHWRKKPSSYVQTTSGEGPREKKQSKAAFLWRSRKADKPGGPQTADMPVAVPHEVAEEQEKGKTSLQARGEQHDMLFDMPFGPQNGEMDKQRRLLLQELEEAKTNWQIAMKKLDYAVEQDQIDYAIYALEAAEKRYEMLLRHAKKLNLTAADKTSGRRMVKSNGLEA